MSKQWGHGFFTGAREGVEQGTTVGISVGGLAVGEHAWHCVNAAIEAIEQGKEDQAIGILRSMRYMLAAQTGRNPPELVNATSPDSEK